MQNCLPAALLVTFVVFTVGCINPLPSSLPSKTSDPAALELLAASAEAHGGDVRFGEVTAINVSYDGEWLNNVWKLQPMLVDRDYRKSSVERIEYTNGGPVVTQIHTGPAPEHGIKEVRWPVDNPPGDTIASGASVLYDGQRVEDEADRVRKEEAAAMVAEAYRMFLTGPFYFTQHQTGAPRWKQEDGLASSLLINPSPSVIAVMSKPTIVLGAECDQVLVELRPGLGTSKKDRVEIAIDRETKYVRRVRFSLDGFRKTKGATADVEMSNFVEHDGLIFPTEFLEIVVHPINREVHRWYVTEMSVEIEADGP